MSDHEDIRKLLSAYCSRDLDPAGTARVEQHLETCAACRSELADLKTALQLIRTSPEVEPPPWLTARVMARVKEQQARKQSWLQRLFFPLHIKLPLEAMALLLVCVTGYYVSRSVQTELKQPAERQLQDIPAQPLPIQEQYGSGRREPASALRPQPNPAPPVVPKAAEQPVARPPQAVPLAPAPHVPAPPAPREESSTPAAGNGIEAMKAEPAADSYDRHREIVSKTKRKAAKGGLRKEAESLSAAPPNRAAVAPSGLLLPQMTVQLEMTDPSAAPGAIREALISSGGTISDESELQRHRIKARIPAARMGELLGRLERLARIRERPTPPAGLREVEVSVQW